MLQFLFGTSLTQEEKNDIQYCKDVLITDIEKISEKASKLKKLDQEIKISIIFLKIFSSYLKNKKFRNIESAWKFMNDIKGIIEKVLYVKHYLARVQESIKPVINA